MTVPWRAPDLFALKPPGGEYGWALGARFTLCTREELIARCGDRKQGPVALVCVPDRERWLPPCEVAFLHECLLEAARGRTRQSLRGSLFLGGFLGLAWLLPLLHSGMSHPLPLLLFFVLGVVPLVQALWALQHLRGKVPDMMVREAEYVRYASWLRGRSLTITPVLFAVLAALQVLVIAVGIEPAVLAAGLVKPAVRAGEWWRLATAPLLHGGLLHLLFNGLALLSLGRTVEALGHRAFASSVFVASALAGGLASMVWLPDVTSVGASGGLMGYFGFLAVLGVRRRRSLPREYLASILFSLGVIAALGIALHDWIDNAAHAGGLVAGLALGVGTVPRGGTPLPLEPGRGAIVLGHACTGALVAAALGTGWALLR